LLRHSALLALVAGTFACHGGERYPCERAGTRSEGADIDAVQALHVRN